MSRRLGAVAVVLAAVAGFATVLVVSPGYLLSPSLPLDDAWAHAAHARSLAAAGHFASAPGGLAGGPASPLWAAVMAVPHLVAGDAAGVVLLVKLIGFALHALAALVLFHVLTAGRSLSPERLLGPLLVAFHPDLVSASLSGVEVPLATLLASALLWAADRAPAWIFGALALVAPFVRPDLAVLALVFPAAMHVRDRARLWRLEAAALAAALAAFGLMAAKLVPESSIPTRAARPGTSDGETLGVLGREIFGFTRLLDQFPVADAGLLVVAAAAAAGYFALREPASGPGPAAPGAMLGGLALCAVSFALLPPVTPLAFYGQRHALPALPLLVGAIPILVYEGLRRLLPLRAVIAARVGTALLLVASVALDVPSRYGLLANDAKNVDETEVAMARALDRLPARPVVWAADGAGALRYFGQGTIIDLSRARALDAGDAQAVLDAHRPHAIEIVPGLSSIEGAAARSLPALFFATTTLDTVDGTRQPKRERWLVACTDASRPDRFQVGERVFGFRCGEGGSGISLARGADPATRP